MENALAEQIREKMASLDTFMTTVGGQVSEIEKTLKGVDHDAKKALQLAAMGGLRAVGGSNGEPATLGARIVKSAQFDGFLRGGARGKVHVPLAGRVTKAIITTDGASGLKGPTQYEGIESLPVPPLGVLDLIPSRPLKAEALTFSRMKPPRPVAGVQVHQGDVKQEAAFVWESVTLTAETLAVWVPISLQALADVEGVELLIDNELVLAVRALEENEVLNGDGTEGHLLGLMAQAGPAPAGVVGDTAVDILAKAIGALAATGVKANGVVLNPSDWTDMTLLKAQPDGTYLLGSPASATPRALWGVGLALSTAMAQGKFLADDFRKAQLRYIDTVNVAVSTEHDDYFVRNLAAIRCEERMLVAVRQPLAFMKGNLVVTP